MACPPFEEIEHPADWAIRVRGLDHAALFIAAAHGMVSLLTDTSGVGDEVQQRITLEAPDVETLLVDWLNEILYLTESEGVVFVDFDVGRLDVGDDGRPARLDAVIHGGRPPEPCKSIKAVTFSGLRIESRNDVLQVDLVFDV